MDATSASCLTFSSNNVDTLCLLLPFISECLSIASYARLVAPIYYCYRFNTIILNAVFSHISIPYVRVLFIDSSILFFTLICHSKKQQKYRIPFFFLPLFISPSLYIEPTICFALDSRFSCSSLRIFCRCSALIVWGRRVGFSQSPFCKQ